MLVSNSKGLLIGSDIVRSAENIRQHYIIERELADRLRDASREERRAGLYAAVYNELFRRVADHPQIARKSNPAAQAVHASRELQLVARFIGPGTNYLERFPNGLNREGFPNQQRSDSSCMLLALSVDHCTPAGRCEVWGERGDRGLG